MKNNFKIIVFLLLFGLVLVPNKKAFSQVFQSFDTGKIEVKNACAVDTNGLGKGTKPVERFYFTATEFVDKDPTTTAWEWDIDGKIYTTRIVKHEFKIGGNLNSVPFSLKRTTSAGVQPSVLNTINVGRTPRAPKLFQEYDKADSSACAAFKLKPYKSGLPPGGVSYKWYPYGETTQEITARVSDLYTVRVTGSNGCYVDASAIAKICSAGNTNSSNDALNQERTADSKHLFGNGILRNANYGSSEQPSKYPNDFPTYQSQNDLSNSEAYSSLNNPNLYHQKRYLFSTDGKKIVNKTGSVLPGMDNINYSGIPGEAIMVPQIMDYEGRQASTNSFTFVVNVSGNLTITEMDTRPFGNSSTGNESAARLVQIKDSFINGLAPKATVSKYFIDTLNFDRSGYHVVFTNLNGSEYYRYFVGRKGLEGPFITNISIASSNSISTRNQLKFNIENNKIYNSNETEIQEINFDTVSHAISLSQILSLPARGFEVTNIGANQYIFYTDGNTLKRYDFRNRKSIIIDDDPNGDFGDLRRFRTINDVDEILVATNGSSKIGSILNPNYPVENIASIYPDKFLNGANVVKKDSVLTHLREKIVLYKRELFNLPSGVTSNHSLNNYAELPEYPNASSQNNIEISGKRCPNSTITFKATPVCDLPSTSIQYEWILGNEKTLTGQNVSYAFKNATNHKIKLIITLCGRAFIVEQNLKIEAAPKVDESPILKCYRLDPTLEVEARLLNIATNPIDPGPNQMVITDPAFQLRYLWSGTAINIPTTLNKSIVDGKQDVYGQAKVKVGYLPMSAVVNGGGATSLEFCETDAVIPIVKDCPPELVVPNIFTPNNDSVNDDLRYSRVDIAQNSLFFKIYNRWGELMYYADDDTDAPWDGTFNGKKLPSDTYAWVATFKKDGDPTQKIFRSQGAVLLVR